MSHRGRFADLIVDRTHVLQNHSSTIYPTIPRSGFSTDIRDEACRLNARCTFRILTRYTINSGRLAQGSTPCDGISLTLVFGERCGGNDNETRLDMYRLAIGRVVRGIKQGNPTFHSKLSNHIFATAFTTYFTYFSGFPYNELFHVAFVCPPQIILRSIYR
jgi:hypothetical protein